MNYLDLINAVLLRLREEKVTSSTYQSTPFYRMIGAFINDAKNSVEDAWNWSNLRTEGSFPMTLGNPVVAVATNSVSDVEIKCVQLESTGAVLTQVTYPKMQQNYAQNLVAPYPNGTPTEWCWTQDNPTKTKNIRVWPPSNSAANLWITKVEKQPELTSWEQVIKVPALPVHALATALASRERGEVQGTPTTELFVFADRVLSDAIARDAQHFPEELYWRVI